MGTIRKYGKHKKWTPEEIAYLHKYMGYKTVYELAKSLHRTRSSVKSKSISLGYKGGFIGNTELYTMRDVAALTGMTKDQISITWQRNGLPVKHQGMFVTVSESQLLKFMKNNPNLWDKSKCDAHFFGKYAWFRESGERKVNRVWTEYEDQRLKFLRSKGLTYKQIGDQIGRTEDAIRSRLHKQKMKRGEFYEICNRSGNSFTCDHGNTVRDQLAE